MKMGVSLASFNPLTATKSIFQGFVPNGALKTTYAKTLAQQPLSILKFLPHLANSDEWAKSSGAMIVKGFNRILSPTPHLTAPVAQFYHLRRAADKGTYAALLAGLATVTAGLLSSVATAGVSVPVWLVPLAGMASGTAGMSHLAQLILYAPATWVARRAGFEMIAATRAAHTVVQSEKLAKLAGARLNHAI